MTTFWEIAGHSVSNVYPGKPQFYYIKMGCKGVSIIRTCFHDDLAYKGEMYNILELLEVLPDLTTDSNKLPLSIQNYTHLIGL